MAKFVSARTAAALLLTVLLTADTASCSPISTKTQNLPSNTRFNLIAPEELGNQSTASKTASTGHIAEDYHFRKSNTEQEVKGLHPEMSKALEDDLRVLDLNVGVPGDIESDQLLEGDIVPPVTATNGTVIDTRKGVSSDTQLWRKLFLFFGPTIIPYTIGTTSVPDKIIEEAIDHYHEHTCLRFKKAGFFHIGHRIRFTGGQGCSSFVGLDPSSGLFGQDITLHGLCGRTGIVIHEIGHALGMFHEQSRSDRDEFVSILEQNVMPETIHNFRKFDTRNFDTVYDYTSVMHYGPLGFSSEGEVTIATTDPLAQGLTVHSRDELSHMDKLLLNRLYGCIDHWVARCIGIIKDPCQNLGYLGPKCKCVCPAGTSGDKCQTKSMTYTEALIAELLPLSEKITTATIVTSPSYPTPNTDTVLFTKIIEAPSCSQLVLNVTGFDIYPRSSSGRCSTEGVEIRLGDPVTSGKFYCGEELSPGQTLESEENTIVIFYLKSSRSNTHAGFSFDISFTNDSCN